MEIDERLHAAGQDLDANLGSIEPPPFEPRTPRSPRVAVAAGAALVLGIGGWMLSGQADDGVDTIVAAPAVITTLAGAESPVVFGIGLVTDTKPYPPSAMAQPDADGAVEPDFGTTIRRLTAAEPGGVIAPVFSGTQTFNADGSLLLLYQTSIVEDGRAGHLVLDLDGTVVEIDIDPTDIEDVAWDAANPSLLRWVRQGSNELVTTNVLTGQSSPTLLDQCDTVAFGETSGTTSSATAKLGLLCIDGDGAGAMMSYDTATGEAVVGDASAAAPIARQAGAGFVSVGDDTVQVLDDRLAVVATYPFEASSFTLAVDDVGNDVLLATVFGGDDVGTAVALDLDSGEVAVIVGPLTDYPYPPSGSGLSTSASKRPTLVAGNTNPGTASSVDVLSNEVFLVDLEGSITYRLAHHRMSANEAFAAWPPSVAVSPTGSHVVFSSDWGTGAVDTYLIELAP